MKYQASTCAIRTPILCVIKYDTNLTSELGWLFGTNSP